MTRYMLFEDRVYFLTYKTKNSKSYLRDEQAKEILLNKVKETFPDFTKKYFYFSILSNHLHLSSFIEDRKQFSRKLQTILGGSAVLINKYLGREGSMWDRYYALTVATEDDLYRVGGYILGNALRHGLVKSLEELYNYKFCNFRELCDYWGREAIEDQVLKALKFKFEVEDEEEFKMGLLTSNNSGHS